jgi:hypothetical protein
MKKVSAVTVVTAALWSLIVGGCGGAGAASAEGESMDRRSEDVAENVEDRADEAPLDEAMVTAAEKEPGEAPKVSFVAAEGCQGVAGTWRGQVYSEPHNGFYEFTAHITQPTAGNAALEGTITARSWQGGHGDVAPPDTCDSGYHWTVVERAAGSVASDGAVTFQGTDWRRDELLCGGEVTDYSPDELHDLRADGDDASTTKLTGVVSDQVVWKNGGLPIEMTRIACE